MSVTKVTINPFSGKLDVYKDEVSYANAITDTRTCLASAAVGDLVMESSVLVNRVDVASDNTDIRPVFAVIIEKIGSTECRIAMIGTIPGFSGLTKSRKVFLSITGTPTSAVPTTGYLQVLGVAKEASIIDFNPQLDRVKRA